MAFILSTFVHSNFLIAFDCLGSAVAQECCDIDSTVMIMIFVVVSKVELRNQIMINLLICYFNAISRVNHTNSVLM